MTRSRRAGVATLDFAIVGTVFVSLLALAFDAGWQIVIEAALGSGGRAASRFGTTGATVPAGMTPVPTSRTDSILQIVLQNSGGLLLASRLVITESSYASFAALAGGTGGTAGPGSAGQVVQYSFTYTQPYLTPIAMAITGAQQMVHNVTVTVLNEPFPSS
jgi:hypothetical protein